MNSVETKLVLGVLRAAFPSFYKDMKREELANIVNLWQVMFADDDAEIVMAAVKALIAVKVEGYPPTIGAVKEQLARLTSPQELTEQEAWALVSKAVKRGYYDFKEEFEKLPEVVQRSIGRAEQLRVWSGMDENTVESVVASNFMRTFRMKRKQQQELAMIPADVRQMLSSVADKLQLNVQNAKAAQLPAPVEKPASVTLERVKPPDLGEILPAQPQTGTYQPPTDEDFEKMRDAALCRLEESPQDGNGKGAADNG